jgi:pimeloyl-ACP methyl ester carboxylesterase
VAAAHPDLIAGVVSRGGRPDLAGRDILQRVRTPVLLIVGAADPEVLELNRSARGVMGARAELVTIPGAAHLFEEPGTLEAMTVVAADWFTRELGSHGERRLQQR